MGSSEKRCFALLASGQDDVYLRRGTLTAIRSITLTNPDVPIVVLHHDLSVEQQSLFAGTTLKYIEHLDFGLSSWSKVTRPDLPETSYLVLFVECIKEFDVAIYIDADAVVLEPLDDLFDVNRPVVARVMDDQPLDEHFENGQQLLDQENVHAKYPLNDGVIRFDLQYLRTHGFLKESIRLFRKYGPDAFRLTDQSLINLVAYKAEIVEPVSRVYNFCRYPDMLLMQHSLVQNRLGLTAPKIDEGLVKVVHWTGPLKPWSCDVDRVDNKRLALCLDCYQQFDS